MNRAAIVSERVFVGGCSNISFLVPVALDESVDTGDHNVVSEIEFSFTIEKRSLYVRLYNMCFICAIVISFFLFELRLDFF